MKGMLVTLTLVLGLVIGGCQKEATFNPQALPGDTSNFSGIAVAAPTAIATATPAMIVDSLGVSNVFEVHDAATPVARWEADGDLQLLLGKLTLSFADLTIANGDWLTPTLSVYALDSAAAVTMTLGSTANEGQLLVLIGDDNFTITINDANARTSDGAAATLGQYDVLVWVFQDSEWVQVVKTANS